MKIKKPAEEIEVCDLCHCEGYLKTCKVCSRQFCLRCDAIVPGCVHPLNVCRECGESEMVKAIVAKYAPKFSEVIIARDAELEQLSSTGSHRPSEPEANKGSVG